MTSWASNYLGLKCSAIEISCPMVVCTIRCVSPVVVGFFIVSLHLVGQCYAMRPYHFARNPALLTPGRHGIVTLYWFARTRPIAPISYEGVLTAVLVAKVSISGSLFLGLADRIQRHHGRYTSEFRKCGCVVTLESQRRRATNLAAERCFAKKVSVHLCRIITHGDLKHVCQSHQ